MLLRRVISYALSAEGARATSAISRLSVVCLCSLDDANQSLRRQVEEKSDIIGRLQSEIQQLVDRINSMETRHSVELGTRCCYHRPT